MARFTGQTQLGTPNLGTGAATGLMSLGNQFQQFGREQAQKFIEASAQQAVEAGQAAFTEGEAPEFKEERFIGGVNAKAFNKGLQHSYLASLSNDIREDLSEAETANPDNVQGYDTAIEGLRQGFDQNVDPHVKLQVLQAFDEKSSIARGRVQQAQAVKIRKEGVATANDELNKITNDAQILARQGDAETAAKSVPEFEASLQGAVEAEFITDDEAKEASRKHQQALDAQFFIGEAERVAQTDGFPAAFQMLEDLSQDPPSLYTQNEWDAFKNQAQTALTKQETLDTKTKADLTIDQQRHVSNLIVMAKAGLGDPEQILKETEAGFDAGIITFKQRTTLLTALAKHDTAQRKKAVDMTAVAERLAGNSAVVLSDNQINTFYNERIIPSLEGKTPLEQEIIKADYVDKTKSVPSALKAEINTFVQSDNKDLIVLGAQMIDRIDNIPGLEAREFSNQQRAFVDQVVSLSANMEPAEAVDLARKITDPNNKAAVEAAEIRIAEDKTGILGIDYRDIVEEHGEFESFFGTTKVDNVSGDQLAKEFGDQYEALIKAGMSKEGAQAKSLQLLMRNWKVDDATGKVTKYPTQDYYEVQGSVDYIRDQLFEVVNSGPEIRDEQIPADSIFLQATEDTARLAAGNRPAYRIIIREEDGSLTPFYGPDSDLWVPDMQGEIDRIEAINAQRLERKGKSQRGEARRKTQAAREAETRASGRTGTRARIQGQTRSRGRTKALKEESLNKEFDDFRRNKAARPTPKPAPKGLTQELVDEVGKTEGFKNKLKLLEAADLKPQEREAILKIAQSFGGEL